MIKTKSGIYQSLLLESPNIVHGFSSKRFGDMRNRVKRKTFFSELGIEETSVVWEEQIHKDHIHVVVENDRGTTISDVDGLVYKQSPDDISIVLSVHTGDCVPLLAVDQVGKIIGVAHAGWKGTTLHIGKKLISEMEKLGAQAQHIRVVIGPRIGMCCYTITANRADVFREEFMQSRKAGFSFPELKKSQFREWCVNSDVIKERNGNFFADIGKANYIDLLSVGIKPEHIDYDRTLCTCCRTNDFYSFRKGKGVLKGEMLGVIGSR